MKVTGDNQDYYIRSDAYVLNCKEIHFDFGSKHK